MLTELRVGPITGVDGSVNPGRSGKTGELLTSDAHGRYFEAVSRGRCFHAAIQAGASLGTALTSTAVTLTLYNPIASGVLLSLLEVTIGITTDLANPGAGVSATASYMLAANVNPFATAPSATTAATVRNCLLGSSAGVGQAFTAATLPATPVVVRMIGSTLFTDVTSANIAKDLPIIVDNTDGKIVLSPNTAVTLQGLTTATSGIVSFMWEEIPLV